jgi:hypothetical protein
MKYYITSDKKNNKSSKSNKPYLNSNISAPKVVRSKLFDFIEEEYNIKESCFSRESWVLLGHILNCSSYDQYRYYFEGRAGYLIPIPYYLRDSLKGERGGHKEFLVPLEEAGLLYIYPYQKKVQCYYYEADPKLRREFYRLMMEYSFQSLKDGIENGLDLVDLASGNEVQTKSFEKSILSDKNDHLLKNVQAKAVIILTKEISINIQLAFEVLKEKRDEAMAAGDDDSLATIESDLMNIYRLQQRAVRYEYQLLIDPFSGKEKYYKILVYFQSFNFPDYLGRIYDQKCAYMGISGSIKSALRYCFYKGKMQWNYDLSCCYPSILKTLGEKYNIVDPLFEGQDIKQKREEISKKLSIPKGLTKFSLNSTIFGAHFPSLKESEKQLEKPVKDMQAISRSVWEFSRNEDEYYRILDSLRPELKAYKKFIDKVIKAWCSDKQNKTGNSQAYRNAVGREFPIKSKYTKEEKNLLQTFILEGYEGAFIQKLITLGEKFGYESTHCEHDGLTATGDITLEAIEEARQFSNFKYARLEAKDNIYQHKG